MTDIDFPPTRPSPLADKSPPFNISANADILKSVDLSASVAATDNKLSVEIYPINRIDFPSSILLSTSVDNKVDPVALSISAMTDIDFSPTRPSPLADKSPPFNISTNADILKSVNLSASVAATDNKLSVEIYPINRIDSPSSILLFTGVDNKVDSDALSLTAIAGIEYSLTRPSSLADKAPPFNISANADILKIVDLSTTVAATDNKLSVEIYPINRIDSLTSILLSTGVDNNETQSRCLYLLSAGIDPTIII
ncbi:hypothetical protein CDIK_0394 [Cucumispora dikerogammari]|nr:hypothetical protein CDIK_0394 [Cucumispora dikerogammari]